MAEASNVVWNVPNVLTMIRAGLAVAVFALIPWRNATCTSWALGLFLLAASTDWIDGYWARRFNQITKLGRVLDPFVDKILICGSYIMIAAEQHVVGQQSFGIASWMAVVVVGREMLVTALRSAIESAGGDFSAKWAGKWKMVLQCGTVVVALYCLRQHQVDLPVEPWLRITLSLFSWGAVLITLYSGIEYCFLAARAQRTSSMS